MDSLSNKGKRCFIRENNKKHPNIYLFVDVLKKVQQTAFVAMNNNSASAPARIPKHEREKRQFVAYFAVAAYYDYCRHVLTREQ